MDVGVDESGKQGVLRQVVGDRPAALPTLTIFPSSMRDDDVPLDAAAAVEQSAGADGDPPAAPARSTTAAAEQSRRDSEAFGHGAPS